MEPDSTFLGQIRCATKRQVSLAVALSQKIVSLIVTLGRFEQIGVFLCCLGVELLPEGIRLDPPLLLMLGLLLELFQLGFLPLTQVGSEFLQGPRSRCMELDDVPALGQNVEGIGTEHFLRQICSLLIISSLHNGGEVLWSAFSDIPLLVGDVEGGHLCGPFLPGVDEGLLVFVLVLLALLISHGSQMTVSLIELLFERIYLLHIDFLLSLIDWFSTRFVGRQLLFGLGQTLLDPLILGPKLRSLEGAAGLRFFRWFGRFLGLWLRDAQVILITFRWLL